MTTIDPPTRVIPSLREIREAFRVADSSVLKTLIVCTMITVLGVVGGLVVVSVFGGDVGPIGTALTAILTGVSGAAGATKWLQRKGNGNGAS